MNNATLHETSLFKLIILVTAIVVAMFFATVLVALVFMPGQLIANMLSEDMAFLLPMALATICSASVLARYVQSHRSRFKR